MTDPDDPPATDELQHEQEHDERPAERTDRQEPASDRNRRQADRTHSNRRPQDQRREGPHRGRQNDTTSREQMIRYLSWGLFGLLCLLGVFGAAGLYLSVMDIIEIWVAPDFEPIFRMLFNLVVILITALGLSVLIRRSDVLFGSSEES